MSRTPIFVFIIFYKDSNVVLKQSVFSIKSFNREKNNQKAEMKGADSPRENTTQIRTLCTSFHSFLSIGLSFPVTLPPYFPLTPVCLSLCKRLIYQTASCSHCPPTLPSLNVCMSACSCMNIIRPYILSNLHFPFNGISWT